MTRGKLLGNNAPLFLSISILIMRQLHPRDPENRQENWFSEPQFSGKTVTTGWMGKRGFISANNALFVAVDLIWEKNQVLLEFNINLLKKRHLYIKLNRGISIEI